MSSLHGGNKKCDDVSRAITPPAPASNMPATGAGNVFGIFATASIFGAVTHHFASKHRASYH